MLICELLYLAAEDQSCSYLLTNIEVFCMQLAICAQMKTLHQSLAVLPGLRHKIFGTIVVWLCRVKCTTLAEVLSITNDCMESLSLKIELKMHGSLYKVYIHSSLN